MEKVKLYALYDAVLEDKRITLDLLHSLGFTIAEVKCLIKMQALFPIADEFIFLDAEGLSNYGFLWEWKRVANKANLCYQKALQITPYCSACFNPIFQRLKNNDDKASLERLLEFRQIDEGEANVLLFLFAFSHPVPKELKLELKNLSNTLPRYLPFEEDLNKMYSSIAQYRFTNALSCLNDVAAKQSDLLSLKIRVYRELLHDAIDHKKNMEETIRTYYLSGKLSELKTYLEFQAILTREQLIFLVLLNDYLALLGGVVIPIYEGKVRHWYDAVFLKQYDLALQKWEGLNKRENFSSNIAHYSYELLQRIVALNVQVKFQSSPVVLERINPNEIS